MKALKIPILLMLFAFVLPFAFSTGGSFSLNPSDYWVLATLDVGNNDTLGPIPSGQNFTEPSGDVDIVNMSATAGINAQADRACIQINKTPGVYPSTNFTVDVWFNFNESGSDNYGFEVTAHAPNSGTCSSGGGTIAAGVAMKQAGDTIKYRSGGAWADTGVNWDESKEGRLIMFFKESTNQYNFTVYDVTDGAFTQIAAAGMTSYNGGATEIESVLFFDNFQNFNTGYKVHSLYVYNGTELPPKSTDSVPPHITWFNLTNGQGCENWNSDKNNPCSTTFTAPTVHFLTDENAYCAISGNSTPSSLGRNYTAMGDSRTCTGAMSGEGTNVHRCTLTSQDELVYDDSYIYISCKDDGGNENKSSTSGPLRVNITSLESNARESIELGTRNALPKGYTLFTDQKVYARNSANTQAVGTFDKVVKRMSKIWAFNRVGANENSVDMFNITPVLYVKEFSNVTSTNITNETQRLILATK